VKSILDIGCKIQEVNLSALEVPSTKIVFRWTVSLPAIRQEVGRIDKHFSNFQHLKIKKGYKGLSGVIRDNQGFLYLCIHGSR